MAKVIKKKNIKVTKSPVESPFKIYWDKKNYFLLYAGILLLIVGFYFMSVGNWDSTASLIVSPIILGIAYILIFPASILYKNRNEEKELKDPAENS